MDSVSLVLGVVLGGIAIRFLGAPGTVAEQLRWVAVLSLIGLGAALVLRAWTSARGARPARGGAERKATEHGPS